MLKKIAFVTGIFFLFAGVLGFFNSPIFGEKGFFQTNFVHNLIHIFLGLFIIFKAKNASFSSLIFKIAGVLYLLVAIYGFIEGPGKLLWLLKINIADNWLNLLIGAGFFTAGFILKDYPVIGNKKQN